MCSQDDYDSSPEERGGCAFKRGEVPEGSSEWRVLLPVDGSAPSMRAAMYLVDMIEYIPARVLLLQCWEMPVLGRAFKSRAVQLEQEAWRSVELCAAILTRAGVAHTMEVRKGHPADEIVGKATDEKCDLIVMGSRGHTGLEGLILGSVTNQVLRTAPCPVLVV